MEGLIAGLAAGVARTRFGSAKGLRELAVARPEWLYPHFGFFAKLLDHENRILQWDAIFILSQLVRVDAKHRFDGVLERFFAGIRGGVLVTAANTMAAGARIVAARPELADRIAAEILTVSHAEYASPECRNVAMGHAIAALEEFVGRLCYPRAVFRFVRRQLRNPRLATRTRAERFLLRHAPHLL